MVVDVVFETHSWSEDNDIGRATGWLPGRLSERGRQLAAELGHRRSTGYAAVFVSDLERAVETARIAFAGNDVPLLLDWRLRECDYGTLNGAPAETVHRDRLARLNSPFEQGESWRQATDRVIGFLPDLFSRWDGARVLIIGHVATKWALDIVATGADLADLATDDFGWREGWEYRLDEAAVRAATERRS